MKEDEIKYCVYVHINKKDSNKAYVGISKNTKKRWRNGEGYIRQCKFYNAIQKYGWNNFKHIILKTGLTLQDAWKYEKYYVKLYDSVNDGYNVHEGGEMIITEEMRKKGYITKRLRKSGVYISSLKTQQSIYYDTIEEASLKTGISEHWFYRYYRKEVNDLFGFLINFTIDIENSTSMKSLYNKVKIQAEKDLEDSKKRRETISSYMLNNPVPRKKTQK